MSTAACHESTLRNTSGQSLVLSMFGGKTLAAGEEFTVPGHVSAYIAALYTGIKARRMLSQFQELLADNKLLIVDSPNNACSSSGVA